MTIEHFLVYFFISLTLSDLFLVWCLLLVISFPAEYCVPFVQVGGLFIAAKGHDPEVCNFKSFIFCCFIYHVLNDALPVAFLQEMSAMLF